MTFQWPAAAPQHPVQPLNSPFTRIQPQQRPQPAQPTANAPFHQKRPLPTSTNSPFRQARGPKVAAVPPVLVISGGHHPLLDSGDGAKENAKVELPNSTWGKASDMLEHVDNTQDSQQVENTQDSKTINPAPYFQLVSLICLYLYHFRLVRLPFNLLRFSKNN